MLQMRILTIAILSILIMSSLLVQGGDVNNPEVLDQENDSKSGKSTRDLVWAYMGHEDNETVNAVIGVSALETFTNPSDILNFPVIDYKLYFTVLGVNYAAVATVPVHGPFGIDIMYELRTVQYNGSQVSEETQKSSITSAEYDPVNGIINMTIPKSELGNPLEGDIAEGLWAAIYSRQREGNFNLSDPELEDRAPNFGYGKRYIFIGSAGNEVIRIEISTGDSTSGNVTSMFVTLKFEISVYNNGTTSLLIDMNATQYKGWSISFGSQRSFSLGEQELENVTLSVRVTNPRDVEDFNNKDISIQVVAETNLGNETDMDMRYSNTLTFNVKADLPPAKEEEKGWQEQLQELWDEHGTNISYAIVAVIVLVVVLVVISKLRGRKEGEEDEFGDLDVKVEEKAKEDEKE